MVSFVSGQVRKVKQGVQSKDTLCQVCCNYRFGACVVGMAKLGVDFDASCIIIHAYQPCLLQLACSP